MQRNKESFAHLASHYQRQYQRAKEKKNQPENCLVSFTLVIFKRKAGLLCQFPRVAIEIYPLPNPRYSQTAEIYSVTVRKAGI